jgi:hypothetical protein
MNVEFAKGQVELPIDMPREVIHEFIRRSHVWNTVEKNLPKFSKLISVSLVTHFDGERTMYEIIYQDKRLGLCRTHTRTCKV